MFFDLVMIFRSFTDYTTDLAVWVGKTTSLCPGNIYFKVLLPIVWRLAGIATKTRYMDLEASGHR